MKVLPFNLPRHPMVALMGSFWQVQRRGFMLLGMVALICGIITQCLGRMLRENEFARGMCFLPFALSLFAVFACSHFTERDRRGRLAGYPSRLFTLPTSTLCLIAGPMLAAVATVVLVYGVWSKVVFPPMSINLALGWPCLYLAAGMACFQASVWVLADFPVLRLAILGVAGTIFPIAWSAFSPAAPDSWMGPYLPGGSFVWIRWALLAVVGLLAYTIAVLAIGRQRRGGRMRRDGWRRIWESAIQALSRAPIRFRSDRHALSWWEWRRQGCILPLCLGVFLFLIVLVSALAAPLEPDTAMFTLGWILLAPFLLAWALGMGFGKIDLWAEEPRFPAFLAIRPVPDAVWISLKLRIAARSAVLTWVLIFLITPLWLAAWCDCRPLLDFWKMMSDHYSAPRLYAAAVMLLLAAILITWRLLVGSIWVGLSGRRWLVNAAVCNLFVTGFAVLFFLLWCQNNPSVWHRWLPLPPWLPWVLALVFSAKMMCATLVLTRTLRVSKLAVRQVGAYLCAWALGTAVLVAAVWLVLPLDRWPKFCLSLLALFIMPALRLALASPALTANRHGAAADVRLTMDLLKRPRRLSGSA